jgi:poly(hydroxyalkanoate) depolymerase family esterase
MSTRFRHCLTALLPFATAMLAASPSFAGSWSALNKDYGGSLGMILYTPTTPAASPAIMVALHYCGGNSSNAKGWFDSAADKNGFYIIAPDAGGGADVCFDASLGRSGERADVVKMVQWVIDTKKADKSRVFAAGFSSGGCMTNTLLAIYPDVFAGGAAMPGVAAGGWPGTQSNPKRCQCSAGGWSQANPTDGKFWGDKARAVFQWTGQRPCVQEWVGEKDEYGFYEWLPTVVAQFRDLGGLGAEAAGSGAPSGWTRKVYKDSSGNVRLETNSKPNQAHNLIGQQGLTDSVISFLGLDKPTGACGITTTGTGGMGNTGGMPGGGTANGGGGGTSAQGGSSTTTGGTTSNSGGKTGGGGTTTGSSGGSANGGVVNNGGAVSLAGGSTSTGSGGAPGNGGSSTGSGGSLNTTFGGNAAKGGASSASGASNASGGSSAGSGGGSNDSGCSCAVVGSGSGRSLGALVGLTAVLGALVRRRRNVG